MTVTKERDNRLFDRLVRDADAVEASGHAMMRTPDDARDAADMVAFSAMDRLGMRGGAGADVFETAAGAVRRGEMAPEAASASVIAELRQAARAMDEADAERQVRFAPRPPTETSLTALRDFDKPGGRGQMAQTQPKPEDAEAEALAAASWDDLPEVVEEERALTALRACAPGGG